MPASRHEEGTKGSDKMAFVFDSGTFLDSFQYAHAKTGPQMIILSLVKASITSNQLISY